MIIKSLVNYYEGAAARGLLPRIGYAQTKVYYALKISQDGELLAIIPLYKKVQGKRNVSIIPPSMYVPEKAIRAGIKSIPQFMSDNPVYLMGFDEAGDSDETSDKIMDRYASEKALHNDILGKCNGLAARAIVNYFERWDARNAAKNPLIAAAGKDFAGADLVFDVEGVPGYAHEDTEIREAWETYREKSEADSAVGVCCITGQVGPMARIHGKIKGVPNGQSSGTSLVSYNAPATLSYEFAQPARVGRYAASAYVIAINALIADAGHSAIIGDTITLAWAEDGTPMAQDVFAQVLNSTKHMSTPLADDKAGALGKALEAAKLGHTAEGIADDQMCGILTLSPNAGRLSARAFVHAPFGEITANLERHYRWLEIERPSYDETVHLPVIHIMRETTRHTGGSKVPPPPSALLTGTVLRAVFGDVPYPRDLLHQTVQMVRKECEITRGRAAIIKACLSQWAECGIIDDESIREIFGMADSGYGVRLNVKSTNTAYVLGRLFSVIEDAQQQAEPSSSTTSKDRFFSSACTMPGIVFPQLLKSSIYHTAKLQYGPKLERDKGEIMALLDPNGDPFPKHLSLEKQGLFILGYYHQTQARYNKNKGA